MGQTIKLKRGLKQNLPPSAQQGEPLVTLDTGELFIGQGDDLPLKQISGGGGGGEVPLDIESRIMTLENKNALMTKMYHERFLNNPLVDIPKTTAAVNRGSVRIAPSTNFTEEFNNTDNIELELEQTNNVQVQDGALRLRPDVVGGQMTSKMVPTQGTDSIVVNSTVNHFEALGFINESIVSTTMFIHYSYRDSLGRMWFFWTTASNSPLRYSVINPDGTFLINNAVGHAGGVFTLPSSVGNGNTGCFLEATEDAQGRVVIAFIELWGILIVKRFNLNGTVHQQGSRHIVSSSASDQLSISITISREGNIWTFFGWSGGTSINVFNNSLVFITAWPLPIMSGSWGRQLFYDSIRDRVIFLASTEAVTPTLAVIAYNLNFTVAQSRLTLITNYQNRFASHYDTSSDRIIIFLRNNNLASTTMHMYSLNPADYTLTLITSSLVYTMTGAHDQISLWRDSSDNYLLSFSSFENLRSRIHFLSVRGDGLVLDSTFVTHNNSINFRFSTVRRGLDGNIDVHFVDAAVPNTTIRRVYTTSWTSVVYSVSNNDGQTWHTVTQGVRFNFPSRNTQLRVRALLSSPRVGVTPQVLNYTYNEWNSSHDVNVSAEFVSLALPPAIPSSRVILTATQFLNGGQIVWFISTNGGQAWNPITLGQPFDFSGLSYDVRVRAVLTTPVPTVSPEITEYLLVTTSVVTQTDITTLQINLINTNFKLDHFTNAVRNNMKDMFIDVFSNTSGINATESAFTYNPTLGTVRGIIISNPASCAFVPVTVMVSAMEILNGASVSYAVSRNGGLTWTEVFPNIPKNINSQPVGTSLVIRAITEGNAEISAWAAAWN